MSLHSIKETEALPGPVCSPLLGVAVRSGADEGPSLSQGLPFPSKPQARGDTSSWGLLLALCWAERAEKRKSPSHAVSPETPTSFRQMSGAAVPVPTYWSGGFTLTQAPPSLQPAGTVLPGMAFQGGMQGKTRCSGSKVLMASG